MEFLHRTPSIVGDAQQQADDHPIGDQRRPALSEEWCGQTREWDEAGDAADDDEDLQGDREAQARGEQGAESVAQLLGGLDAALEDEEVAEQDDEESGHAQFFAEAGVDEV